MKTEAHWLEKWTPIHLFPFLARLYVCSWVMIYCRMFLGPVEYQDLRFMLSTALILVADDAVRFFGLFTAEKIQWMRDRYRSPTRDKFELALVYSAHTVYRVFACYLFWLFSRETVTSIHTIHRHEIITALILFISSAYIGLTGCPNKKMFPPPKPLISHAPIVLAKPPEPIPAGYSPEAYRKCRDQIQEAGKLVKELPEHVRVPVRTIARMAVRGAVLASRAAYDPAHATLPKTKRTGSESDRQIAVRDLDQLGSCFDSTQG